MQTRRCARPPRARSSRTTNPVGTERTRGKPTYSLPSRRPRLLLVDGSEGCLGGPRRRRGVTLFVTFDDHLQLFVRRKARSCRDEPPHDDVLLETAQVVDFAGHRGLGEDLRRLLEGAGADERLRRKARLRDSEKERLGDGGTPAALDDALILALEDMLLDLLVDKEVRVSDVLDTYA